MSRTLLISDANIIIDIIAGELTQAMFALEYDYAVPDVLYFQELESQHSEIIAAGLRIHELQPESVLDANRLFQADTSDNVSLIDCMALALAKQERCALLTGDAKLRKLADTERVQVMGTLWLVQEMFDNGLIGADDAETAYRKMIEDGSRLPEREILRQIRSFRK